MGQLYLNTDANNTASTMRYDTVKLKDILLPGSHNSGAYKIMGTAAFGDKVPMCGALADGIPWSSSFPVNTVIDYESQGTVNLIETQRVSIFEQLMLGVRFLDLRLGRDPFPDSNNIRIHHTFFMDVTLAQVFEEVNDFLSLYSTEVVIMKLRPQCGVTREAVNALGMAHFGGPLTQQVLSSPLKSIQGKAYILWDAAANSDENGITVDEYYHTNACNMAGTSVNRMFGLGGASEGTCPSWPDYNQDQGGWLRDTIRDDILTGKNQLSDWLPETTDNSFRVLSYVGVTPLGQGCDPSSEMAVGVAVLSCSGISIDSLTETFSSSFRGMLQSLANENGMIGAINTVQVDYVDTFDLTAIVELNQLSLELAGEVMPATSLNSTAFLESNSTATAVYFITSNFSDTATPQKESGSTAHVSVTLPP